MLVTHSRFIRWPLGPLGFERAQHRRTSRPTVDGIRSKALCPFGSQQRISRISSTVQTARGERPKGDPEVGHVKGYKKYPRSHAHQDPKSARVVGVLGKMGPPQDQEPGTGPPRDG